MNKQWWSDALVRIILFLWAVITVLPIVWIIYESLKTNIEFYQNIWALPQSPQFTNYIKAWTDLHVMRYMMNTFIVVAVSLVVTTLITAMGAYIFARFTFQGRKLLFSFVLMGMMLPGLNSLAAQYILMKDLSLLNSLTGLSIFLTSLNISFSVFVLTGFMQTIPLEMEESAYMDGSSYSRAFFRIILPMCKPGLIAINIFNFLAVYNNYIAPLLFISDENKFTIALGLNTMLVLQQYRSDWVTLFAGTVISMIPIVVFYVLFQRHLISGTNLGAIKA